MPFSGICFSNSSNYDTALDDSDSYVTTELPPHEEDDSTSEEE
jgi:hypothetical protein